MMRGPCYDDNYIERKMTSLQSTPTFMPPGRCPMGGYMQNNESYEEEGCEVSPIQPTTKITYAPSAKTQLILNRVALTKPSRSYGHVPPPRMAPRMAPTPYYDDYYGGGGYGGYSPYGGYGYGGGYYQPQLPMPRYNSGYSPYMDDDYDLNYVPRYRPSRLSDTLVAIEREKQLRRSLSPSRVPIASSEISTSVSSIPPTDFLAKHYSPSMLQENVDNMRIRLKALSFSLDPSGPVPEIIIPERSRRVDSTDFKKKYSSGPRHLACVEFAGPTPQWKRKARARYPSEDPYKLSEISRDECTQAEESAEKDPEKLMLKDRLSMKIHNYLCDSLTPDQFQSYIKNYRSPGQAPYSMPDYTSRYASAKGSDSAKWEEPDKIYATSSTTEKKPYSKTADTADDEDARKERRKKKKSKEREDLAAMEALSLSGASTAAPASALKEPAAEVVTAEATERKVSSTTVANVAEPDTEMDEKERKRIEKKKRKAEREAAAKAAMEAELAALAAAEAELAKLEAETANIKGPDHEPAPAAKASETPADKCESQFEFQEFECEPSSFAINESLQEHETDLQIPEDPVAISDQANEATYETAPVEEEPQEEQHKVTDEEINAMLEEETDSPYIGDEAIGTERTVELPEEPSAEQQEPQVEIEPEQPEETIMEIEPTSEPPAMLDESTEHQEELIEPSIEYPEEFERTTQPEDEAEIEQQVEMSPPEQQPEQGYEDETLGQPTVTSEYFFE